MSYKKVLADTVKIEPAYIKGMEVHGLCYFTGDDSELVGAQCSHCHTVIWVVNRDNKVLMERRPADIPPSGEKYTAYYIGKRNRFLKSLPACPECGKKKFDKFINNVEFPRLEDGMPLPEDKTGLEEVDVDNTKIQVWLYEED